MKFHRDPIINIDFNILGGERVGPSFLKIFNFILIFGATEEAPKRHKACSA